MASIEQTITIGWINDDWRSNIHGEDYISCGSPERSATREMSVNIKTDDDNDSAPLVFVCEEGENGENKPHELELVDDDNWWADEAKIWSIVAKYTSDLAQKNARGISGAQLAGCWRIFNNESDDDEHEESLKLEVVESSAGEFSNEGLIHNGKFYARYMTSVDGEYDDDEEKVILIG